MNDVLARIHNVDYKRRRARRLRPRGPVHPAPDRALVEPVRPRAHARHLESMEQLKSWLPAQHPAGRRDAHQSRRLSAGQHDRASDRAAHHRRARLGAVDARPSAGRPRLQLHGLPFRRGLRRVGRLCRHGPRGVRHPERDRLRRRLCRRTGRKEIADWDFYVAFSLFRLAAIVQGVYKRGLDGNASSDTAKSYGDRARVLADLGWSLVERGLPKASCGRSSCDRGGRRGPVPAGRPTLGSGPA